MTWKPFARVCGACGLSLAVVLGEEHEHVHVEAHMSPAFYRVDTVVRVATTSTPIRVVDSP